jgi:3-deoxy-D-arabino-heptulosonate 7-phosphate (DAHP) synthase
MDALQQAREKALYDASHGASRKKIAQDQAVVDELVSRMRYGR